MTSVTPYRIKSISQYHHIMGLPKPQHPLVSVINFKDIQPPISEKPVSILFDFYSISMKRNVAGKVKYIYGQQHYDFDEGVLFFIAPGQVFAAETDKGFTNAGWMLLVHPDFLWNTPLAKKIKQYEYFSYAVNEALHLSEKEEIILNGILQNVENEYHSNIDKFSQEVIIAQLELLLTYSERFYERQFITRKKANHLILNRLENMLDEYFNQQDLIVSGLPTVQFIAGSLNVSPNYLSGVLKTFTGKSTQQLIHEKLIEIAKQKLSTTALTVSEIAYGLGFEHSQSFSRLFKTKTNQTPLEFRQSFN